MLQLKLKSECHASYVKSELEFMSCSGDRRRVADISSCVLTVKSILYDNILFYV